MSRQTTNYGLTKPDYTDTADIEVVNANMDIIDGALKVIDTKSNNVMSKNSSAWSSTVAYAVGQYCIYNNSLWKCLVQHSGQTPQEGTYWARVSLDTLDSEINALNSNQVHYDTITIDEADDIDAFIKKIMNYTVSHYEGTFAIRGAWTGHDFFFVTGASWKSDICFGIISFAESAYIYKYQQASGYVFYKQLGVLGGN